MNDGDRIDLAIAAAALVVLAVCIGAWTYLDAVERADWRKWRQEKKQNARGVK